MLTDLFTEEKIQLPCWIPCFIAIGILLGFQLPSINIILLILPVLALLIGLFFGHNIFVRISLVICISILLGLAAINIRLKTVNSPIIEVSDQFFVVKGKINNITPLEHGHRVLMENLYIKRLPKEATPSRIRLTVRTSLNNAKIGDYVKVNAILSKPMSPYLPGSYDFARDAYFKRIGAVGYSVSGFTVINSDKKTISGKLNALRNNIQTRVNNEIGTYTGSIATALMLNEYSNIDKNVLMDLRATGLAHILSVSGMHLSLVAAIFFFSTRFLLNCFSNLALHLHCKKIAAFVSLLGSLAYLLISGMEVAAIRSFIMTSMIIIAIIIDRTSTPMRAIALAAIIILLIAPENIIHPSFQMSFAAVLALIACYELFKKLNFDIVEFNLVQKWLFYFLSVSFSSLVAGLATAPFALYHFGQSSNYSILANLLAVPITSFWLMPCVVLTFLLYPFHLEFISLYLMKPGINLMLNISHHVAKLPYAVSSFAKISDLNLLIITLGFLWFCLWRSKIRFIGVAVILVGIILQSVLAKPDIFIDRDNKTIAVLDEQDRLIFLSKPLVKFKKQLLMNYLGAKTALKYPQGKSDQIDCQNNICIFRKSDYSAEISLDTMQINVIEGNKNIAPKVLEAHVTR
jgi:competence protein ComEC